jgi:hypothetical protein
MLPVRPVHRTLRRSIVAPTMPKSRQACYTESIAPAIVGSELMRNQREMTVPIRERQARSKHSLARSLHYIAGTVLLLCAVSHLRFLAVRATEQRLPNELFPFLNNQIMYAVAAALEMFTGVLCLIKPARDFTDVVILSFVSLMVWYRIVFYYLLGGVNCNCLGYLGRLLHLSKAQETMIPIIILVVLTLTTLPGLQNIVRHMCRTNTECT